MSDPKPLVDQCGREVSYVITPQGGRFTVGDVVPPEQRGASMPLGSADCGATGGTGGNPPASIVLRDNAVPGLIYTMPTPAQPTAQAPAQEAASQEERPWYERAWDEAYRVGEKTVDGWIEGAGTVWDAISFGDTSAAAWKKIGDGVMGTLEGLGTLMGPSPEMVQAAYMSGDPEQIAIVQEMQQRQQAAAGAVVDSVKDAWNKAYERNGAAGASAMVLATLGMEVVGGKGTGAVLKMGERVAEIVRLAKTPLDAVRMLEDEIAAARKAGKSVEEIQVLEKARAERLAQAEREAVATGRDGASVLAKPPLTKAELEKIEDLRAGKTVYVADYDEARRLLDGMPELKPAVYEGKMPNPTNKTGGGFADPPGTYRGDLINKSDPSAPVHPNVQNPDHRNYPHYNIKLPNGDKASIIINGS